MKFGELKSIGHNIADSLASGIGLMIGVYETDVFGEARATSAGFIEVDFLNGSTMGGTPSRTLQRAIELYRNQLESLCERHGTRRELFRVLKARYATDKVYGAFYTVIIADHFGRTATDKFIGVPGRRVRQKN